MEGSEHGSVVEVEAHSEARWQCTHMFLMKKTCQTRLILISTTHVDRSTRSSAAPVAFALRALLGLRPWCTLTASFRLPLTSHSMRFVGSNAFVASVIPMLASASTPTPEHVKRSVPGTVNDHEIVWVSARKGEATFIREDI